MKIFGPKPMEKRVHMHAAPPGGEKMAQLMHKDRPAEKEARSRKIDQMLLNRLERKSMCEGNARRGVTGGRPRAPASGAPTRQKA
jgi:hypothetical protein